MLLKGILLEEIEKFTDQYQITFQFWGKGENNVYIDKDFVELADFGGEDTIEEILLTALRWLYRVNNVPEEKQIFNGNPNF